MRDNKRKTVSLYAVQQRFSCSWNIISQDQHNQSQLNGFSEMDILDLRAVVAAKYLGLNLKHSVFMPILN